MGSALTPIPESTSRSGAIAGGEIWKEFAKMGRSGLILPFTARSPSQRPAGRAGGSAVIKGANSLKEIERRLLRPAEQAGFSPDELDGLPEPIQRYFTAAIAPGTPLATCARLRMKGQIKVKKWLPFRARQVLSPHLGFVWAGRAGGVIVGSDSYFEGKGLLDWKVAGLITVAHAEGADVSRSAAGRGGAEAIWLPTALLPRFGVRWSAEGPNHIKAEYSLGDTPLELNLTIDEEGRVENLIFDRWGDPDASGTFGEHPFGGEITGHATFHGVTIPSAGRLGWHYGTDRWPEGEFFRFDLVEMEPQGRS